MSSESVDVAIIGGGPGGATTAALLKTHRPELSVAVFEHVEALEFADAHRLAGGMVAFSLVVLMALYLGNRRAARVLAGT